MKDKVGQDVKVGDMVAYCTPRYSDLSVGEVLKLTPKGINVQDHGYKSCGLSRTSAQFVVVRQSE